ncbi:sensor histidine kinase [Bradyrhizobium sp.]|uniref:sensor histidine kinase n=1 Tax=Bradyrhizobium sp. TaxID=376 RepID=UPI003C6FB458
MADQAAVGKASAGTDNSLPPGWDAGSESARLPRRGKLLQSTVDEDQVYAAVVQSVGDAIVTKALDGKITGWNRSAERMFGFSADEAIGRSIDMIVPPDLQGETAHLLERTAAGESIDRYETVRCAKDGRLLDVSLSISPVRTQSGTIIGAAKVVRDLTEQRFAERKFQLAVEACPSGILMIDAAGVIALANAELERQFGYPRSELIGKSVDLLLPERLRQGHIRHRSQFRNAPAVRAMGAGRDLYGRRKDGSEFAVEIGLNPITALDGAMVLATVIDITARKEAEAAIEAHNEQLRRSNAELEQFAYIASHDLQEPLRMVASFTQLLEDRYSDKLDDRARKYIGYAVEGAKRMQSLVRDLLAYSRVTSTEKVLKPVESGAVVAAVAERLSAPIRESGTRILVHPLPVVISDELELGQVFQNLISNAVKFRAADRPPRIEIAAERQRALWRFSVADNGIGIDQKFGERIFQMFQRLHERSKYDGSGIGLAIAKKIVERHGGKIWFVSAPDKGTTFHFTLPAKDQDQ